VPHPRWSQETEELLGTGGSVPTGIFNGYGEQVAHLHPDIGDPTYFRWRQTADRVRPTEVGPGEHVQVGDKENVTSPRRPGAPDPELG
jgi:hypothetical protein